MTYKDKYYNKYGYYDCSTGKICTKCERVFDDDVEPYNTYLCVDCKAKSFEVCGIYVLDTGRLVKVISVKSKHTLEVMNWERFKSDLGYYVYEVLFKSVIGRIIEIP